MSKAAELEIASQVIKQVTDILTDYAAHKISRIEVSHEYQGDYHRVTLDLADGSYVAFTLYEKKRT